MGTIRTIGWVAFTLALCWACTSSDGASAGKGPEAVVAGADPQDAASETVAAASQAPAMIAEGAARAWRFDDTPLGQLPGDVVVVTGRWAVSEDNSAPSASRVLEQMAANGGSVFNLVLVSGTDYQDLDLSVQMRALSGRIDRGGGLVWRAQDAKNYYIARYNPLEDNFRVYKVTNGHRRQLKSARLRVGHEVWHSMRVVMRRDHIECFLDGTKQLDVYDTTFVDAGQIGVWTKADAKTRFDDLEVAESAPEHD